MIIKPKNWQEFQHYKDRCPPWIKLHKSILDNYEFHKMSDASKALAMCLWLVASEHLDGEIDATPEKLAFRFRTTGKKIEEAIKELIVNEFFFVINDDSKTLAQCKQVAPLEETETETEAKFILPEWINSSDWNLWIKTRKGKKLNDQQKQGYVDKLWKWMQDGIDYKSALKDAALAGWQGIHEPKQKFQSKQDKAKDIADHLAGRGKYATPRLD